MLQGKMLPPKDKAPRHASPHRRERGIKIRIMLWYPKEREGGIVDKNSKENGKDK